MGRSHNARGAAEAAPLVTSYGSKSLGAHSRYVQFVVGYFELTACSAGEPLVYLKMLLMTHFFAGVPRPDLEVHLALMKLALLPVRLVPGAPFPVGDVEVSQGQGRDGGDVVEVEPLPALVEGGRQRPPGVVDAGLVPSGAFRSTVVNSPLLLAGLPQVAVWPVR